MESKPVNGRASIPRIGKGKEVKGGITVPGTAMEKPLKAQVHATGTGMVSGRGERLGVAVQEDDPAMIGDCSGTELKTDDDEFGTCIRTRSSGQGTTER
jgi:chaperonin GroES